MSELKKVKLTEIRSHLKELSKDELENEIIDLVKNFKEVREHFSIKLSTYNEDDFSNF